MSALGQYPVFEEDQSSFLLSKTRPHSNVRNEDCCLAMMPLRLTTASKWYRGQEALLVSPLQVHFSFREALRSHFASRKIGENSSRIELSCRGRPAHELDREELFSNRAFGQLRVRRADSLGVRTTKRGTKLCYGVRSIGYSRYSHSLSRPVLLAVVQNRSTRSLSSHSYAWHEAPPRRPFCWLQPSPADRWANSNM